jgi:uncharacterized protein (DUF1015 family)
MPRIEAFRALRYADAAGDPADLLAPPYDVVGADEARRLRARSPFNAVRLVLPEGEAPGCYELAARRLRDWTADGLLARDDEPALWVYGQSFRHGGREITRHGVFGALRLSEFGEGEVVPHEETHRGPKEDRLALVRAARAQLSPVFLIVDDPAGRLPALVDRAVRGGPALDAETPDGIRHRLWRVVEGPLAEKIREAAGDGGGPLLIADGHHRYETALEMGRGTPEGHPARRTLACVVGASDPGLVCLPTHRALSRPPDDGWRAFLEEAFEVRELDLGEGPAAPGAEDDGVRGAPARAAEAGAGAMVAMPGAGSGEAAGAWLLRPRAGDGAGGDLPDGAPAPVVFDRLVLRRGWGIGPDPAVERGLLGYHRDAADALRDAGSDGAAFLLPPPDVDAIREAAERGERLPPKSTYFWPKLPSGLLFRPLAR